jgi:hypothetical protein
MHFNYPDCASSTPSLHYPMHSDYATTPAIYPKAPGCICPMHCDCFASRDGQHTREVDELHLFNALKLRWGRAFDQSVEPLRFNTRPGSDLFTVAIYTLFAPCVQVYFWMEQALANNAEAQRRGNTPSVLCGACSPREELRHSTLFEPCAQIHF